MLRELMLESIEKQEMFFVNVEAASVECEVTVKDDGQLLQK